MKILAIIPARGGSKGIARKNIRDVAGKPLIAHTIKQALASTKITKVIVTTDNEEIAQVARNYGAEVIIRPTELAQDNTPMLPVLKHVVETVKSQDFHPDYIVLLQPTSPLRKTIYINNAIDHLINENVDSLTSVSKIGFNPSCLVKVTSARTTTPLSTENFIAQRQDIKEIYNINGLIYVYKTQALLNLEKGSWCNNNGFIITPPEDSLDIDDEYQLQIADYLLRKEKVESSSIKIQNKNISIHDPILIIAEAGSNYNGSLEIAKRLVDIAVEAEADIVKFQTFKADLLVTRTTPKAQYQKQGKNDNESYYDLLKGLEMEDKQWKELKKYCDQKGIIFMSTPHSGEWSVDFLESLDVPAYKLGSGDLTNLPFLEYVAKKNKPMIISVGMAVMEEIKEAVETIQKTGNNQLVVLQCTTSYPADIKNINLNVMDTLAAELGCIIGFSDHTPGIEASVIAAAKGARVIEKHFTIDKNLPGPDHKASLSPSELKALVQEIRHVELMLGSKNKKITKEELEIAKIARKSIIAAKDIPKGTIITDNMLVIKRPGTGLLPKQLKEVIGRKAKENISSDTIISWEILE